jgi:hypothetical protein
MVNFRDQYDSVGAVDLREVVRQNLGGWPVISDMDLFQRKLGNFTSKVLQ